MTKIGSFLRGFSVVDSSAVGFLDLLKTLKTQRQKSLFLYKSDFHWQSNAFLCVIYKLMVFLIKEKMHRSNVQLLKETEKKITTRGLFISTLSPVKLIAEIRVYTCHKNMKSMGIFYSFSTVFAEKYIKNLLQEMKNGLSFRQEQLQVIMSVLHFISSLADKTNAP